MLLKIKLKTNLRIYLVTEIHEIDFAEKYELWGVTHVQFVQLNNINRCQSTQTLILDMCVLTPFNSSLSCYSKKDKSSIHKQLFLFLLFILFILCYKNYRVYPCFYVRLSFFSKNIVFLGINVCPFVSFIRYPIKNLDKQVGWVNYLIK